MLDANQIRFTTVVLTDAHLGVITEHRRLQHVPGVKADTLEDVKQTAEFIEGIIKALEQELQAITTP